MLHKLPEALTVEKWDDVCMSIQVIPGSLWAVMDQMVLCSKQLQPLPSRIEATALKDLAQLEQRATLASLAAKVSAFAAGIHQIDRCLTPLWPISCVSVEMNSKIKSKIGKQMQQAVSKSINGLIWTVEASAMPCPGFLTNNYKCRFCCQSSSITRHDLSAEFEVHHLTHT